METTVQSSTEVPFSFTNKQDMSLLFLRSPHILPVSRAITIQQVGYVAAALFERAKKAKHCQSVPVTLCALQKGGTRHFTQLYEDRCICSRITASCRGWNTTNTENPVAVWMPKCFYINHLKHYITIIYHVAHHCFQLWNEVMLSSTENFSISSPSTQQGLVL